MIRRLPILAALVFAIPIAAHAQTGSIPLSPLEIAVACAPPPAIAGAHPDARQVIGAQDTAARTLFDARDLLVVDGGTAAGLQLDQQFFVRRNVPFGTAFGTQALGTRTLGWIRIVAVNESTAVARVDHLCDGISVHDYLEPFALPILPPDLDRDDARGEPDFSSLGRFVAGESDRATAGAGDFMLIDWGANQGIAPGARLAIYRDVQQNALPLASVGEAVVVSVGPMLSLTRITRARDAVRTGDYVALRK
jgi:hypothetical protein